MNNLSQYRDTVFSTSHRLDKICVLGEGCKVHTHLDTTVIFACDTPGVLCKPTSNFIFLEDGVFKIFVNEFGDTMLLERNVPERLTRSELTRMENEYYSHSIKPCDSSLIQKTHYVPATAKDISRHREEGQEGAILNGDAITMSLVFVYMVKKLVSYTLENYSTWVLFSQEVRNVMKS